MDTQQKIKQDLFKQVEELSEALEKEENQCQEYFQQLISQKDDNRRLRDDNKHQRAIVDNCWKDSAQQKREIKKLQKENAELKRELNSLRLKM